METIKHLKNIYKEGKIFNHLSVLDIACGKGGDLFKWKRCGVHNYVGVDISKQQVIDAHQRWKKSNRF